MRAITTAPRSYPAPRAGDGPGLDSVAGAGLADRRREVVAHGALGEVQALGDLGDRGTIRARLEHLALARGERALAFGEGARSEFGIDHPLARRSTADRVRESLGRGVLDQEPRRSGL